MKFWIGPWFAFGAGCGFENALSHWGQGKFYSALSLETVGIILAQRVKNPALSKKRKRKKKFWINWILLAVQNLRC